MAERRPRKVVLPVYPEGQGSVSTRRVMRRPQHSFQVRTRPWQIQPVCIAPVLPGETMKTALLQSRVVVDPIKHPLIGWWKEYYFFYVPFSAMEDADDFKRMLLEPDFDVASLQSGAVTNHYHYAGSINWVEQCLNSVVKEYFRADDETILAGAIDGLPTAKIAKQGWWDSAINSSEIDDGGIVGDDDDAQTYSELDKMRIRWELLREMKMTEMTYDDYLATYGVSTPRVSEAGRPELLRYIRDFQYPVNTVDPATGAPSSAVSWAMRERADKDRFFREPGFLFTVTVTRPKVYLGKQKGAAASMLESIYQWLPAILQGEPGSSLLEFAPSAGPFGGNITDSYVVDARDLFIHGDQFVNFALTETDAGFVALPSLTMNKKYASATDADALFKTPASAKLIREDGIVTYGILGRQTDQT